MGGAIHAEASFSNAGMETEDTECASLKWTGTFTSDGEEVSFDIRNNNAISNAVVIPATYMQIAYKIFNPNYANI